MPNPVRSARRLLLLVILSLVLVFAVCSFSAGAQSWSGVDEAVVEKVAKEHGRQAKPLFDTGSGDLMLFVFLVAGVAGGFAAGYFWRDLIKKDR